MRSIPCIPENLMATADRFQVEGGIEVGGCLHHLADRTSPNVATAFERTVRVSDIWQVVDQLDRKGCHASWVMFMFNTSVPSAATDDQCINLQYSIEDGQLGLDWILLGERNIVDQKSMSRFSKRRGHTLIDRETNDVSYIRIEDGDIRALGLQIVERCYGVSRDTNIGVLHEGFALTPPHCD
jgi:hypothetical protein